MKVLVAGGAGYIGSTVASACIDAGITPIILDNLVTGRREFTTDRIFYEGDIADGALLDRIFAEHPEIEAAIHLAALIVVPESVAEPLRYYRENVGKSVDFASHLLRNKCHKLLFSSSASIYVAGADLTVDEESTIAPASPYARTKAMMEEIFVDVAAASEMRVLSLRYFNPVGADPKMRSGLQTKRPTHALGVLLQSYSDGVPFPVTGIDYPTRDGSGIRDYIHVWDLAQAHVAAVQRMSDLFADGESTSIAINLGTGDGTTVRELLTAFNAVVGEQVPFVEVPRRPGDVVGSYTRSERARDLLGWTAQYSLADGIRHSMEWLDRRDSVLA